MRPSINQSLGTCPDIGSGTLPRARAATIMVALFVATVWAHAAISTTPARADAHTARDRFFTSDDLPPPNAGSSRSPNAPASRSPDGPAARAPDAEARPAPRRVPRSSSGATAPEFGQYFSPGQTDGADARTIRRASPGVPTLRWRVENPFRLFSDPALTERHRRVYETLSPEERRNPVLAAERALSAQSRDGWAADAITAVCWQPRRHRYGGCRDGASYVRPKSHRIIAHVDDISGSVDDISGSVDDVADSIEEDAATFSSTRERLPWRRGTPATRTPRDAQRVICTWRFTARGKRAQTARGPCGNPESFDVPYPAGGQLTVTVDGDRRLTARVRVEDLFIVGLGDSYASGDGNPDAPARFTDDRAWSYGVAPGPRPLDGYPTRAGRWENFADRAFVSNGPRWLGRACRRSLYAYQTRVALQLAIERHDRAVSFVHFACGGAEIPEGLFIKYKGGEWVPSPPRVPQISAVAEAQCDGTRAPETNYPDAYTIQG
ncbi:MAG: hypothetical protein AAFQ35_15320, partial [Pseudomonadota bacterium]